MQKCGIGVVLLLLLFPFLASAQSSQQVAFFDYDDFSCGAWVKSAGNATKRDVYRVWFRGFVSGYNFGNSDNQVSVQAMPDDDSLDLYIEKYCREKPLQRIVGAAFKLVVELREKPETKKVK